MVQIWVGHTRISRLLTNKMVKWLFKIFRFTDCSSLHVSQIDGRTGPWYRGLWINNNLKDIMFGNSLLGCLKRENSDLVESRSTGPGTTLFLGRWGGLRYFGLKLERPAGASWCQVGLKRWKKRWGPQWSTSTSQCWIQMAMWPSKHLII